MKVLGGLDSIPGDLPKPRRVEPEPADLQYFKAYRLVAADYFLPKPIQCPVTVLEGVSFYNGSDGLRLFFDAYLPPAGMELPGGNSTLIRIHGGGWTVGDKGAGNMPLMNRYFASQGYCVFDIQYGLSNQSGFLSFARPMTSAHVLGNYSINDMVKHIGAFCQYLVLHQGEYSANLSSVFFSGGSAGGTWPPSQRSASPAGTTQGYSAAG